MKLKNTVGLLALLCLGYCVYVSVNVNPDLTIGKWLGYKFGLNLSENVPFKLITIALIGTYGYLATTPSDGSAGPK